jgi:hypothetical protein
VCIAYEGKNQSGGQWWADLRQEQDGKRVEVGSALSVHGSPAHR